MYMYNTFTAEELIVVSNKILLMSNVPQLERCYFSKINQYYLDRFILFLLEFYPHSTNRIF